MRKVLLIFIVFVLLLIIAARINGSLALAISYLNKKGGMRQGELTYRIYLLGVVPVAEAKFFPEEITEYQGNVVYHLSAKAINLKFLSKFFSGSADIDSYVDTKELTPVFFKQKLIIQNKPEIYREVSYDQKENIMTIEGVRRQILPDTQDPLSLIFNLRRRDFASDKEFEFSINTSQKNYILQGKAEPKDIAVNKKIYKAALLSAQIRRRDKNNPYHQSKISMVLLREYNNLPISIKIFASGFLINARLIEIR